MPKKMVEKFQQLTFGRILVFLLVSFYFLIISGYYLDLKGEHFVLALIIFSVLAGLTIGWQAKEKRVRKAILFPDFTFAYYFLINNDFLFLEVF